MRANPVRFGRGGLNKFRNHVRVQLDVTLAIPVNIHVELDALSLGFGDEDTVQFQRHGAKVDLGEVESLQWTR